MSAVMPVDLPLDDDAKKELERGARKADKDMFGRTKRRLTSRWATFARRSRR